MCLDTVCCSASPNIPSHVSGCKTVKQVNELWAEAETDQSAFALCQYLEGSQGGHIAIGVQLA